MRLACQGELLTMDTVEEIRGALQSMQEKLLKLSSSKLQEVDRRSLLGDARDLVKCLERPEEVVFRQSFEVRASASICSAQERIFKDLPGLTCFETRHTLITFASGSRWIWAYSIFSLNAVAGRLDLRT